MTRTEAVKWLRALADNIENTENEVVFLLPGIDDFQTTIINDLRQVIATGERAKKQLELVQKAKYVAK